MILKFAQKQHGRTLGLHPESTGASMQLFYDDTMMHTQE